MTGIISTGNLPRTLVEGINTVFGNEYKEKDMQFLKIYKKRMSKKNFEQDVMVSSFGLAPVKNQGSTLAYDSFSQGYTPIYTNLTYAKGFIVTKEMYDDDQYGLFTKQARLLGSAFRKTKEYAGAAPLNHGFDSSYVMTGGDGKALFATDHPLGPDNSGTFSNKLSVATALSEAALEQILINIDQAVDSRNLRIGLTADKLVVPAALGFEAERIIKSVLQSGASTNNLNAIMSTGRLPGGYTTNNFLSSSANWFVTTDAMDGLVYQERQAIQFGQDNDFGTSDYRFKALERYVFGWSDPRGAYGSGS